MVSWSVEAIDLVYLLLGYFYVSGFGSEMGFQNNCLFSLEGDDCLGVSSSFVGPGWNL